MIYLTPVLESIPAKHVLCVTQNLESNAHQTPDSRHPAFGEYTSQTRDVRQCDFEKHTGQTHDLRHPGLGEHTLPYI